MRKIGCYLIFFALILVITPFVAAQSNDKISSYILQKAHQETIPVDIYLENPQTKNLLNTEEITKFIEKIESEKIIKVYEEAIRAKMSLEGIKNLAKSEEVRSIEPHLELQLLVDDVVSIVDADITWERQINEINLDGTDVSVCVIDTGVDFTHPDLEHADIAGGNFICTDGVDCPQQQGETDTHSHGTHVAGIIAAAGEVHGVAKGANIVSMKVFPDGNSDLNSLFIKRAVNKCNELRDEYNIKAITISIGSIETYSDYCDWIYSPLTTAINNAFENNLPVTIATGNAGNFAEISYPSCIEKAVPVAATNKDDTLGEYSNLNEMVKILAPGTAITSTCLNGLHCVKTGTSMATPAVAAVFAVVGQALTTINKEMTPHEAESLVHTTGESVIETPEIFTRINMYNALFQLIPPECPADTNSDEIVNMNDLLNVLGSWGECEDCNADTNNDEIVDSIDLATVLDNWGQCSPEATMPQHKKKSEITDEEITAILQKHFSENNIQTSKN